MARWKHKIEYTPKAGKKYPEGKLMKKGTKLSCDGCNGKGKTYLGTCKGCEGEGYIVV